MSFRDRWVLVTGAASGLGPELARQLAQEHGAHILAVARRAERLEVLGREVVAAGVQFRALSADLARGEDVERVVALSKEVPLYAAVLNAGVTFFGEHRDLDWERFLATGSLRQRLAGGELPAFAASGDQRKKAP